MDVRTSYVARRCDEETPDGVHRCSRYDVVGAVLGRPGCHILQTLRRSNDYSSLLSLAARCREEVGSTYDRQAVDEPEASLGGLWSLSCLAGA